MSDLHEKNSIAFSHAIEAIQKLRGSVTNVFDHLKDGKKMPAKGNEVKERAFLSDLQAALMLVTIEFEQFEKQTATLPKWTEVPPLGNTSLLSLDPVTDRLAFYREALDTYKWSDKMREHCNLSAMLLSQFKRSSNFGLHASKRKKPSITSHAIAPDLVDAITSSIDQYFTDLNIQRILTSPYVLKVTLSRTFTAIIVLRGLLIERVVVRATHEKFTREDGSVHVYRAIYGGYYLRSTTGGCHVSENYDGASPDENPIFSPNHIDDWKSRINVSYHDRDYIEWYATQPCSSMLKPDCWTPSKYLVFQKITDHVTATMLHYHYPNSAEIALRQFMNWLRSYNKLFSSPCKRCGKHLQDNLPPTHRDQRKFEPYHESCR